jgi:hypothetical protein
MYLAGHGSHVRPRLIELQYRRIERYRDALRDRLETTLSPRDIFADFRLPQYALGQVDTQDVPAFDRLLQAVQADQYAIVFIDLDETRIGFTPDYESAFVRELLGRAGAKVLNSFGDDGGVFQAALKARCGASAREYEVTESSDAVCFFPALASEITSAALRKELLDSAALEANFLRKVNLRIEALRTLRPYSGGGKPFVENRLSAEWSKRG